MAAKPLLLGLVVAAAGAAVGYQYARQSPEVAVDSSIPAAQARRTNAPASIPLSPAREYAVASLAEAIAQPTDFTQTLATYVLAGDSDETRLRRLIAEADGMSHQGDRTAVLQILFSRYGDIDPRAALAFLDESRLSPKANLLGTIFYSWSKVDLDGAISAVYERSDPREQPIARDAILRAYQESGNDVLAGIRNRLPSGNDGLQSLNEIFRLVAVDPEAAIARALDVSGLPKEQVLAEVAARWAQQDPEAAYAYSAQIQDATLQDWFMRGVFVRWAERDPDRVIAILNQGLSRADETVIVNAAMRAMASSDPRTAFDRVQNLRDSAVRSTAYQVLMRAWAPSDPAAAARAVELLEDDSVRQQLGAIVVTGMTRQSPDAALDWALEIDGGYGPTWSAALAAIAQENPQRAINRAFAVEAERDRNQSLMSVIAGLVQSSPETAANYWTQIPDENMRSAAAMQIAGEWARRDAGAAERWVLGLPAGTIRENSLRQLIAVGAYGVLDTARLVNSVENADRRADLLRRPLLELARSEGPAAAQGLLDQVALPPERRIELSQAIRDQATQN